MHNRHRIEPNGAHVYINQNHAPLDILPPRLALKTLIRCTDILSSVTSSWWLAAGTLLGIHRDKGLVDGDTDIDVEVFDAKNAFNILRKFEEMGFPFFRKVILKGHLIQAAVTDKETGVLFDIFFYYQTHKGGPLQTWSETNGIIGYPFDMYESRTTIQFKEKAFPCFSPDRYCNYVYGPDWRTPTKNCTWRFSE